MGWTLEKQFRFEAAHHLPEHDGKCRRVHGHSWVGRLIVTGDRLQQMGPKMGMVVDYTDLKAVIEGDLEAILDHHDLNETTGLPSPTSEALARFLYERWVARIPGLAAVTIEETCTTRCTYQP